MNKNHLTKTTDSKTQQQNFLASFVLVNISSRPKQGGIFIKKGEGGVFKDLLLIVVLSKFSLCFHVDVLDAMKKRWKNRRRKKRRGGPRRSAEERSVADRTRPARPGLFRQMGCWS